MNIDFSSLLSFWREEQRRADLPAQQTLKTILTMKESQSMKGAQVENIKMEGVCTNAPKSQLQPPHQVYSIMILPQVHLRKPCYDFYFL